MATLSGELGFSSVPSLLAQADALTADGRLDLSGVTRVDSAGLSLLLELSRHAQRSGRTLSLSGAGPQLRELARFFQLDDALRLEGAA